MHTPVLAHTHTDKRDTRKHELTLRIKLLHPWYIYFVYTYTYGCVYMYIYVYNIIMCTHYTRDHVERRM